MINSILNQGRYWYDILSQYDIHYTQTIPVLEQTVEMATPFLFQMTCSKKISASYSFDFCLFGGAGTWGVMFRLRKTTTVLMTRIMTGHFGLLMSRDNMQKTELHVGRS